MAGVKKKKKIKRYLKVSYLLSKLQVLWRVELILLYLKEQNQIDSNSHHVLKE